MNVGHGEIALSSSLHFSPTCRIFRWGASPASCYHHTVHTPSAKGAMPREAEISLNEREFIKQALQEQVRLDDRAFDAFRKLELTFGDEYGVADVQLGKTRYVSTL